MTKPSFTFHHLFSSTYPVSLRSGEFLGNVEFDNGLVEQSTRVSIIFPFPSQGKAGMGFPFHSSVKNQGDAARLVVEIGDSWRAMRA